MECWWNDGMQAFVGSKMQQLEMPTKVQKLIFRLQWFTQRSVNKEGRIQETGKGGRAPAGASH